MLSLSLIMFFNTFMNEIATYFLALYSKTEKPAKGCLDWNKYLNAMLDCVGEVIINAVKVLRPKKLLKKRARLEQWIKRLSFNFVVLGSSLRSFFKFFFYIFSSNYNNSALHFFLYFNCFCELKLVRVLHLHLFNYSN